MISINDYTQPDLYSAEPPEWDPVKAATEADEGMTKALRAERVALWKQRADAWLAERAVGSWFTADALVHDIGLPDAGPARNNVVGAWVSAQSRTDRIRFTGTFKKSARVIGHGNLQRIWEKR